MRKFRNELAMAITAMLALSWFTIATAAEVPSGDTPLDEIVVTGEFPGPGMWKVSSERHPAHVLWIVGDPPPMPRRITWRAADIEEVVLRSQEILLDSIFVMEPDEEVGLFKGISLLPAALRARKNPGEARLEDLVPADLYARWLVQKRRYLGRNSAVERWRPIFAAEKLRREAFDDLGLRDRGVVWDAVSKLAKKNKIATTTPSLRFTFKKSEIKHKLKEFSRESLSDIECFATSLALTEAVSDRATQNARARAWATADLQALAALPPLPNAGLVCGMAVLRAEAVREVVPADIRSRMYDLWLEAAEKSLARNDTTFAIVSLSKLVSADGYLAQLRERGYLIEPPR